MVTFDKLNYPFKIDSTFHLIVIKEMSFFNTIGHVNIIPNGIYSAELMFNYSHYINFKFREIFDFFRQT